jgi:dihydroxy-acid dehydratase
MTQKSLENVIKVDLAIGGSTNSAIHLPAIAHEMSIDFNLDWFNEYNKEIPTIVNVAPTGSYGITDLYRAGGIPAVLKRLENHLNLDCLTVSGKSLKKMLKKVKILDEKVIKTIENPVYPEGGTVILKGNLAPQGAVLKQSAVRKTNLLKFSGKAIVFNSEKDAIHALLQEKITNGHVVVIRYEGPKGGPGMPELLAFTANLMLFKDLQDIALITDGRFSGATWGPCIGHVCPEAYEGGLIAIVEDGDLIEIDIPRRKIQLKIPKSEIESRFKDWERIERKITSKTLLKYRKLVTSASEGAVLKF